MSTANEHSRTLLAAIIPARSDLLDRALRHLSEDHLPDLTLRNIFKMLERYADVTGGAIITRDALGDILARTRADAGTVASYCETYDLLAATAVDDAQFRWSLEQLRELAAERATAEALTQSMEILTRGAQDDRGVPVRGHHDARQHLLTKLAEIDRELSMQDAPEGDMRSEADDMLADYAERKALRAAGRAGGIEFGVPALDQRIGGVQPGELCLIAGYTSEGKTSMCVNMAWHNAVKLGRNVVILTTETLRPQVRRRILSRHSCHEPFGLDGGINSRDLKNGTLHPELEDSLRRVVRDFTDNPGYGRCYICQVPRNATMGYVESKLARIGRLFTPDLVVMDYLALLKPDRRRNTDREELSNTLKEAKQLATTYNDGHGVAFVSPWQVSRNARQEAERTMAYTNSALSETAEAGNSPDLIVSLLAPLDNDQRYAKLKGQVMKNRDGERLSAVDITVDYATSRFSTDQGHRVGGPSSLDMHLL